MKVYDLIDALFDVSLDAECEIKDGVICVGDTSITSDYRTRAGAGETVSQALDRLAKRRRAQQDGEVAMHEFKLLTYGFNDKKGGFYKE